MDACLSIAMSYLEQRGCTQLDHFILQRAGTCCSDPQKFGIIGWKIPAKETVYGPVCVNLIRPCS